MFARLKQLFADPTPEAPNASVPPGQRIYAVGDIHGRRDLFEKLIEAIEEDDRTASLTDTTVILLGDLVDRGPDSAGVLERARDWQQQRHVRILAGNHEEMFLESFESEQVLRHFLRHGGRETVLSFGLEPELFRTASLEEVQALMDVAVPHDIRAFVRGFEDTIEVGDYLFVHAGIDPSRPIEGQSPDTLRWIREPFLSHSEPFPKVVVHGHTIHEEVQDRGNRIGIDTGAFASGRLTALVLEGTQRRYLETAQRADGTIVALPRVLGR
jgi:serine/threonine protein phosphatase 1